MKVEKLMTRNVRSCRSTDSLQAAAQIMWQNDCGCVPVVNDRAQVIGMITDRDICMATMLQNARPADIQVGGVMSKDVHTCRPNDSIEAAEKLLEVYQIRRLPIVDEGGCLVGILSLNDIAREAEREVLAGNGGRDVSLEGLTEAFAAVCTPRAAAH